MIDFSYLSQFLIPCMLIASLIGAVAGWNIRRCIATFDTANLGSNGDNGFSKKSSQEHK